MTRLRLLGPLVLGILLAGACNKPSEENCRKALTNMQVLLGTDLVNKNEDMEGEVRRCKGGSSREAVDCAIKATSREDLRACGFMKVPAGAGSAGSATGSAGSAAGSATTDPAIGSAGSATGSAATDPAMGSAAGSAGSATGSAAGSAATDPAMGSAGSAATGSATGSAAAGSATGSATK